MKNTYRGPPEKLKINNIERDAMPDISSHGKRLISREVHLVEVLLFSISATFSKLGFEHGITGCFVSFLEQEGW